MTSNDCTRGDFETRPRNPHRPSRRPMHHGFVLITLMLWTLLLTTVLLLLQGRVSEWARTVSDVDSQLYSQVIAENGIEFARTLLPATDLNSLLLGRDGVAASRTPGWRNPVPWEAARSLKLTEIRQESDDGLPHNGQGLLLPQGFDVAEGAGFFIRFSNNPGEPEPDVDSDGIVLVRSMGIVPGPAWDHGGQTVRNAATLVEAELRQERSFAVTAALTLFGVSGDFQWEGDFFSISGGDFPALAVIEAQPGLEALLYESLAGKMGRLEGQGQPPIANLTDIYSSDPRKNVIFSTRFWNHFETNLPRFADPAGNRFRFFSQGGRLSGRYNGMLVTKGDFQIEPNGELEGLLVHLGEGRLTVSGRILGGVWMSNLDSSGSGEHRQLEFTIRDSGSVQFDEGSVNRALALLPPTQLGWRLIFPEMVQ